MDSPASANFFSFEQDDLLIKSMPILQELRKNGVFCDLVVKAEDQEFPAHRIILAAAIPYFHKMLTSDFVESKQREIAIKEMDPSIVEALIDFCYSGKIKVEGQNVQKLMKAADFVGLIQVKNACVDYLKSNIQADNVLELIKFADLLNCQQLVFAADKFINENFSKIAETKEFLMLEFEDIKKLIGKDDLTCSEENLFEAAMKWVKHEDERSSLLPEILTKLRFSLVSPQYLVNVVSTEKLIDSSNECVRIVDKAKNYHLMRCGNELIQKYRNPLKFSNIIPVKHINQLNFYDIFEKKWLSEEVLNEDRSHSAIVSMENKVYVIGGGNDLQRSLDVYDLETKKWSKGKNMISARISAAATALNDCIYVCGGEDGSKYLSSVERYSLKENNWKGVAPMTTKRYNTAVTSLNGFIYAIGGFNSEQGALSSCEKFDPKSNTWTAVKPLLQNRHGPSVATLNNKIYICGGSYSISNLNSCEVYDPSANTWSSIAPMNEDRYEPYLASYNGKLYAVGGSDNNSTVEIYSPESNSWELLTES